MNQHRKSPNEIEVEIMCKLAHEREIYKELHKNADQLTGLATEFHTKGSEYFQKLKEEYLNQL